MITKDVHGILLLHSNKDGNFLLSKHFSRKTSSILYWFSSSAESVLLTVAKDTVEITKNLGSMRDFSHDELLSVYVLSKCPFSVVWFVKTEVSKESFQLYCWQMFQELFSRQLNLKSCDQFDVQLESLSCKMLGNLPSELDKVSSRIADMHKIVTKDVETEEHIQRKLSDLYKDGSDTAQTINSLLKKTKKMNRRCC